MFDDIPSKWVKIADLISDNYIDLNMLQKIELGRAKVTIGGNGDENDKYDITKRQFEAYALKFEYKNGRTKALLFEFEKERDAILDKISNLIGAERLGDPPKKKDKTDDDIITLN